MRKKRFIKLLRQLLRDNEQGTISPEVALRAIDMLQAYLVRKVTRVCYVYPIDHTLDEAAGRHLDKTLGPKLLPLP